MEASALKYHGGLRVPGRSPLLRLQSDERLITLLRRGNAAAFEVLVSRYESRLLAFCRHLLGSREDAEDVLQEVMTAAFNAIVADERPINVRPWLYRIARNRSLNHLRRTQAIGVDSMDHHFAESGASTADKVHQREEFRLLVGDIQSLPETQRTALVLREMDALSYEQIAEAMETTVSSVKSLLVRARVSLTEAAEARLLSCDEVRLELAAIAEGLQKRVSPLVRRHLKDCDRCSAFRSQLKATNKALAALLPVGPLVVFRKLAFLHLGHSAGYGAGSTAGATAAGSTASAGAGAAIGASTAFGGTSMVSAGIGAVATKAAAGLAAAVIVTAGAVEVDQQATHQPARPVASVPAHHATSAIPPAQSYSGTPSAVTRRQRPHHSDGAHPSALVHHPTTSPAHATSSKVRTPTATTPTTTTSTTASAPTAAGTAGTSTTGSAPTAAGATGAGTTGTTGTSEPGTTQTQTDPTTVPTTTTAAGSPTTTATGTVTGTGTATAGATTPTTPGTAGTATAPGAGTPRTTTAPGTASGASGTTGTTPPGTTTAGTTTPVTRTGATTPAATTGGAAAAPTAGGTRTVTAPGRTAKAAHRSGAHPNGRHRKGAHRSGSDRSAHAARAARRARHAAGLLAVVQAR
ncbi:MAG TPA: sigma-70 family RNA polymerase sigma factor [Solirubrobacteraceae bacterium]|nr:sigma-70 family RNA polymerase sigma factor [Solirubrobacteraceae bacterium]